MYVPTYMKDSLYLHFINLRTKRKLTHPRIVLKYLHVSLGYTIYKYNPQKRESFLRRCFVTNSQNFRSVILGSVRRPRTTPLQHY